VVFCHWNFYMYSKIACFYSITWVGLLYYYLCEAQCATLICCISGYRAWVQAVFAVQHWYVLYRGIKHEFKQFLQFDIFAHLGWLVQFHIKLHSIHLIYRTCFNLVNLSSLWNIYSEQSNTRLVLYSNCHFVSGSGMVTGQPFQYRA
jgi:hypothetical protein